MLLLRSLLSASCSGMRVLCRLAFFVLQQQQQQQVPVFTRSAVSSRWLPGDISQEEQVLRAFDLDTRFGPCAGMTRLERLVGRVLSCHSRPALTAGRCWHTCAAWLCSH